MEIVSHILSVDEMYDADRRAMKRGVSGRQLMENAGQGVAAYIEKGWDVCSAVLLCGPGNNGGDGYVIARALADAGWPITVYICGDVKKLGDDAKKMFDLYQGEILPLSQIDLSKTELIVDAVFGAGFRGVLPVDIQQVFFDIQKLDIPIVAVDMPSGVNGNTGEVSIGTPVSNMTVSFFRPKIGHLLYPGRGHAGLLEIIDIGIPSTVSLDMGVSVYENDPDFWNSNMPKLLATDHKYSRGHAAIVGGGLSSTGAARLAAKNSLRIGAGAVSVVSPPSALMIYSLCLEAIMVRSVKDETDFASWLIERRIGAVLIGPGNGVQERTRTFVCAALETDAHVVLDADALSVFQDNPEALFQRIRNKKKGQVVLTPHEAEFARVFDVQGSVLDRCRASARISGAIVLLKGASTVIAHPTGIAVINTNAPPWLATAGSGDALAGIITGLSVATDDVFKATCAAAWIHAEVANQFGVGLIAEDIESRIPDILNDLMERSNSV